MGNVDASTGAATVEKSVSILQPADISDHLRDRRAARLHSILRDFGAYH
jgi:hypothetical protein